MSLKPPAAPPSTAPTESGHDDFSNESVPSVTRLLNRKSLRATPAAPPQLPKTEAPRPPIPQKAPAPAPPTRPTPTLAAVPQPVLVESPAAAVEPAILPTEEGTVVVNEISLSTDTALFGIKEAETPVADPTPEPIQLHTTVPDTLTTGGIELVAPEAPIATQITSPIEASEQPKAAPGPTQAKIVPASPERVQQASQVPIPSIWMKDDLKFGGDPVGTAIVRFQETNRVEGSLFLRATESGGHTKFVAWGTPDCTALQLEVWSGITWDPLALPELWTAFQKVGYLEISPPATEGVTNPRILFRKILGAGTKETVTLIRCGNPKKPRGILICFSKGGILDVLSSMQSELQGPEPENSPLMREPTLTSWTGEATSPPPMPEVAPVGEDEPITFEFAA